MSTTATLDQSIAGARVMGAAFWAVLSFLLVVWPIGVLVTPAPLAVGLILILITLGGLIWHALTQEVIRRLRADAIAASVRSVMGLPHD